jgi:polysaccharide biosynthesis protein PslA
LEPSVTSSTAKLDLREFLEFVREYPVDEVIVVDGSSSPGHFNAVCDALSGIAVSVRLLNINKAENSRTLSKPVGIETAVIAQIPIEVVRRPLNDTQRVLKRLEDFFLALLALVLLSPLMGIIALLIKIETNGPVLFCQTRLGIGNQHYTVFKFRTMHVEQCDYSGVQATVQNDSRVTKFGAILRKSSLDELPQLFNVLIGHMSIVGPRPHPVNMRVGKILYDEVVAGYAARHRVKTGITGWAQVNCFRGEVKDVEHATGRVVHDLWYIDNYSVLLDIKIILLTFWHLLTTRQAY